MKISILAGAAMALIFLTPALAPAAETGRFDVAQASVTFSTGRPAVRERVVVRRDRGLHRGWDRGRRDRGLHRGFDRGRGAGERRVIKRTIVRRGDGSVTRTTVRRRSDD